MHIVRYRLVLTLKQGAGAPAQPVVKPGEQVKKHQLIATVPEGAMGSVVHAPYSSTVAEVTTDRIILRRNT